MRSELVTFVAQTMLISLTIVWVLFHHHLGAQSLPDILVLVLMFVGFLLVIVSLFLPKIVGKSAIVDDSHAAGARAHEARSLERVENNLLKLEETARETFGRIDTRSRLLIRLIEETEVRRREIDEMVERLKGVQR